MYIMLSGYLPFHGSTLSEIYDKIMDEDPSFDKSCWDNVSDEAIELIKRCLNRNWKKRITASEALNNSWFDNIAEKKLNPLSDEVYQSLRTYEANSILK